jgi:membrane protein DedA with SNARE-associated domain
LIPQFFFIALGTLVSEDLTCIATGVLIAQGKLGFVEGVLACLAGIFFGDILLFLTGRLIGRRALRWPALARFLSQERVDKASTWLSQRGLIVVFVSRFTPGLRLATYFAAGSLHTRIWSFAAYFLLASILWTPLLVGSTVLFGEELLQAIFAHRNQSLLAFAAVCAVAAVIFPLFRDLLTSAGRRRLIGFLKRKIRWEFWPPWAAYLPLAPYLAYLAFRYRSMTLFTAANPEILSGGFVGESKSRILEHLKQVKGAVAEFDVIPAGLEHYARIQAARRMMWRLGLSFPIVLKPDVGERGSGVAVIRTEREMEDFLRHSEGETILQRYIGGAEFGIFYYRYPNEAHGRIFSMTEKRFPEVVGDGRSTLADLILRDPRAVCMSATYAKLSKRSLDDVPATGERIQLAELGSHCRGAIFLDGSRWKTRALEKAIDKISLAHPGFYFGRFDVRTLSAQALQLGIFSVIELNGVAAEATHVYDPAVSLLEAYRVMFRQWRIAFEIGAMNRARGAAPMSAPDLLKLVAPKLFAWTRRVPRPESAKSRGQWQDPSRGLIS